MRRCGPQSETPVQPPWRQLTALLCVCRCNHSQQAVQVEHLRAVKARCCQEPVRHLPGTLTPPSARSSCCHMPWGCMGGKAGQKGGVQQ